jgi:hypothetical protein
MRLEIPATAVAAIDGLHKIPAIETGRLVGQKVNALDTLIH